MVPRGDPPVRPGDGLGASGGRVADMGLTHFDAQGAAHMVDVGDKAETRRVARAAGRIVMKPETLALIRAGTRRRATCSASRGSPRSRPPSAPPT